MNIATRLSLLLIWLVASATSASAASNPIVVENAAPGSSSWQLTRPAYGGEIEGYVGAPSVNKGESVTLYINSQGASFTIEVFRMGWYQGLGARQVLAAGSFPGQNQPACPMDITYGTTECKWTATTSIATATNWTSGVYLAKLHRTDNGFENYVTFVVRDDSSRSDILFDSNVNTMQAYNNWGGKSLYPGDSAPPRPAKSTSNAAAKVSFDRPLKAYDFQTINCCEDTQFLRWEYPMVRWLESQGFDTSYTTNLDTGLNGAPLLQHRIYVTAGHGEYLTSGWRNNIEAALAAGVNLAFFTANSSYWQVRFEPSSSGVPNRVMVGYKESAATYDPLLTDPSQSTTRFRDAYINRPENRLLGAMYGDWQTCCTGFPFVVSDSTHPFYRNTGLVNGSSLPGLVGDEWDNTDGLPTSNMPASTVGLMVLSNSPTTGNAGASRANAVVRQTPSGALVFDAATFQWSWALDNTLTPLNRVSNPIKQITTNILVDMGAQPATPSNVVVSQTFSISGNVSGASSGTTLTLRGPVNRIVSTDATGNYVFKLLPDGSYTVTVNQTATPASQSVPVSGASVSGINFAVACPCSIWGSAATPAVAADGEAKALELGVKFRADVNGVITGIRYYKSSTNTGAHVGSLWTSTGTLLAQATFSGETTTGWQQVNFSTSVAISAGVTYVASYHTNTGHYAADSNYFANTGVDSGPLHALKNGVSGSNGVYAYSTNSVFPTQTFQSTNYWVDVVFNKTAGGDVTPPAILSRSPSAGATNVALNSTVSASFNESVQQPTIVFTLKDAANVNVPASLGYNNTSFTAVLTPTAALRNATTYTATVSGAKDVAGNPMVPVSWSFATTGAQASCPCTIWPATVSPVVAADAEAKALELGVKFRSDVSGFITGIRYYKSATNTGIHVGSLWSASGTLLAQATFNNESTSGWQQVTFAPAVAINAGTTYVVSYHTNTGHYAADSNYFANAAVDNAPLHALRNGVDGGNGVYAYGANSVFPNNSFQSSNYWVDAVFATSLSPTTVTIWPTTATPTVAADPESVPVEVGVKFRADVSGTISGIRFYKSSANTGVHVGSLWKTDGTLLAQATFSGETVSGWQQVNFPAVSIAAGTTYIASYHTVVGRYAGDAGFFVSNGADNGPLHALKDGMDGPNGVYSYGAASVMPTNGFQGSNYWVDVVFSAP